MPTTTRAVSDLSVPAPQMQHHQRAGAGRTEGYDTSLRQAALAAGIGLLLMTVLAPFANFGVLQKLIVPGDAATTAHNLAAAQGLFRIAIGSLFVVAILDVVVAWGLYIVFQPVSRSLSLLAALFRLVYATMLAIALNNLVSALQLVGGADFLNAFGPAQVQAQMMVSLNAFQSGWDLALIMFGVHLFVLGTLVFWSGRRLWVLGILVVVAGLGYVVDGCGKLLVPDNNLSVGGYTFVGESLLMFWLLWKGIRGVEVGHETGTET
jgi:hypothetical protein